MKRRDTVAFAVTAAATILVDQLVKIWIVSSLAPGETFHLVLGIDITHVKNSGAAFGIFSRSGGVIFWVSLVVVIVAVVWLFSSSSARKMGLPLYIAVGLMVGGAVGNLIDRVFRANHTVVDFVDVHIWPVFNVADVAIVVGVIIVVLALLLSMRSDGKETEAERG